MILMRPVIPLATAVLPLALVATGCGALSDDAGAGDGVTVAAAFYPLSYAADRVAGDHAEVTLLTQPGGEPHDLELTVRETAEISESDLVVYEAEFQPAVDDAVEQNADGAVLDAAEAVDLLHFDESEDEHAAHAEDGGDEDGGDEHAEDEHDHDHGEFDPHFWHDPLRMSDLGDALAEDLAEIDPDNADAYRANAEDLRADMTEIDEQFATGLADCERDSVVVSHDAFSYLEKYGLHFESIAGLSPDSEPTPAHLGELQDLIRTDGITTVFTERLAPAEWSEPLATDLGIDTAVLDPIEGLTDETSDEDYASLMASNLEALRTANGCR
jgi:zinc transport system substrate-binding protein